MDFQKTINLPKKTSSNNDLSKKETIRKKTKKLKQKKQYLLSAYIMILLYKNGISKNCKCS